MTTPSYTNPSELFTPFLPTTYNTPEEDDRLDKYLVDHLSNFADTINDKRIGTFTQEAESFNGEKWIYLTTRKTRTGYQTIAYIPSYPNTGTLVLTVDTNPMYPILNVNQEMVVTQVWGSATKPPTDPDNTANGTGDYFSFFSEGNSKITFTMSNKQIVITTTTDMSAYSGFIVIQYVRDGY